MRNLIAILAILAVFFCVSCSSSKTYIPVTVDLTEQIEPVLNQKPDNTKLEVIENPKDVFDIVFNSETYFYAWNIWQGYAEALENVLTGIRDSLKSSEV